MRIKKPFTIEKRETAVNYKPEVYRPGRSRKVAFIGSHHSVNYAPWHDPSWEIWSHASTRTLCKRPPDRIFDVHPTWIRGTKAGKAYLRKIAKERVPIYMAERYPEIPMSERYPLEQAIAQFQPPDENVFTSHAAWMFALALMEGVTHIGVWGISYGASEERETQRESLLYWIGYARGQGVHVYLTHRGKYRTNILREPKELYGYESHDKEGKLIESYRPKTVAVETNDGVKNIHVITGNPDEAVFKRADIGEEPLSSMAPWNYYKKGKK